MEVITLVLAWKVALPHSVAALRGNHESRYAVEVYGFKAELRAKYGAAATKSLYRGFLKLFACLPLGARVGRTFIAHGGLFRKAPVARPRATLAQQAEADQEAEQLPLERLGSLEDLRAAKRGGPDPNGIGAAQVATDVLWSDPSVEVRFTGAHLRRMRAPDARICPQDGLRFNVARGCGLLYGPDATARFLSTNGLRLVIRSHEGPDAREKRPEMGSMADGFCEDHATQAGRLVTLFSAPDYPQHVGSGEARSRNRAAFAVLHGSDFDEPAVTHFSAAPRPDAPCYYDLDAAGSDEEGPGTEPHAEVGVASDADGA